MKKGFIFSAVALATMFSASVSAQEIEIPMTSGAYSITVGSPGDPIYANAGENLRNGVGSIQTRFGNRFFICTATAISSTHVLTAAHCVRDGENPLDELLFVLSAGLETPIITEAVRFTVNPNYDAFLPFYGAFAHGDLAVLELAQPLPDYIETYEIYRDSDEFNQPVRHYGHGTSGKGNKGVTGEADYFYARTGLNMYEQTMAPLLGDGLPLHLIMDFDSGATKHNAMQWWFSSAFLNGNTDNPVVANKKPHIKRDHTIFTDRGFGKLEVGTSPGDSGGPAFIDGKIAGIHSFGFTSNCKTYANETDMTCGLDSSFGEMSGDARVSAFQGWIDAAVAGLVAYTPIPAPIPMPAAESEETQHINQVQLENFASQVLSATMKLEVKN